MEYEWDEEKRRRNFAKHRVDFAEAIEIFDRPLLSELDRRRFYGEERWMGTGWMRGRLIFVVFTERGETVRVISARKASKHEREKYFRNIRD